MLNYLPPGPANHFYIDHIRLLLTSYQALLKQPLLIGTDDTIAEQVYNGEFALLSHNTDSDPLFNYANLTALALFELEWHELIKMPSRLSAETLERLERERLLMEVSNSGYIQNYSGIRIAKSGKRFLIQNAVVWNIYDDQVNFYGQAAYFKDWRILQD